MKIITEMDLTIERIRDVILTFISVLLSVFAPVKNILIFLLIAFTFNMIMGIRADLKVNKAPFNQDKFFKAFRQLMFFASCVLFISISTILLSEHELGTIAIKWLSLFLFYGYSLNIFKNAKLMHPENWTISFIYEILSTEIFDRIMLMVGIKK